jgi:hypothetical protein
VAVGRQPRGDHAAALAPARRRAPHEIVAGYLQRDFYGDHIRRYKRRPILLAGLERAAAGFRGPGLCTLLRAAVLDELISRWVSPLIRQLENGCGDACTCRELSDFAKRLEAHLRAAARPIRTPA